MIDLRDLQRGTTVLCLVEELGLEMIDKAWCVTCDHEGCKAYFLAREVDTEDHARAQSIRAGWRWAIGNRNLCPDHLDG